MRIHVLSDLHLDHTPYTYTAPPGGADLVVLAGDIASETEAGWSRLGQFLQKLSDCGSRIIYVPGNHEFYGGDVDQTLIRLRTLSMRFPSLSVLDCEWTTILGFRIAAATLWSDFSLDKDSNGGLRAEACISDFTHISEAGSRLTWKEMASRSRKAQQFLRLQAPQSDLVITHFLSSIHSIDMQFSNSTLNSYFAVDLSRLVSEVDGIWIHGHTHTSCDYKLGRCRVICNPRGYGNENRDFKKHLVVTLE